MTTFAPGDPIIWAGRAGIDDGERAEAAIRGIAGKRLTYRQPYREASTAPTA
jgi:hypothetical protein